MAKKNSAEKPIWFIAASCYDPNDWDGTTPLHAAIVRSVNERGAWQCFKRLCVKRGLVVDTWFFGEEVVPNDRGDFIRIEKQNVILGRDRLKEIFEDRLLAIL